MSLTTLKELSVQAEQQELCYAVDRAKLDRIPIWQPPVGLEQPDAPVMLAKVYPSGRIALMFLEPRYQLSRAYMIHRLN